MPFKSGFASEVLAKLTRLSVRLEEDLIANSARNTIRTKAGDVTYQEFYSKLSKPIIDDIDRVLAQHYGLTDEELDFIINYDIKYRMGASEEEE